MNKLFFKSPKGLSIINSQDLGNLISDYLRQVKVIQQQNRELRGDCQTINRKLDRLLVDKHLQMQVDEYFNDSNVVHPEDRKDED